jgi:hypothetical protein
MQATVMNNDTETQEINAMLLKMRDGIRAVRPGPVRDWMQGRFDRMIDRIGQVPDRVMAEYDKRGLKGGSPELAKVWRTEMESALSVWEQDA